MRLKPSKQLSLKQGGNNKIVPRFYGPYKMNTKISHMAYGLELLDTSRIHNVFHVSCLTKAIGQHQKSQTMLSLLHEEGQIIFDI